MRRRGPDAEGRFHDSWPDGDLVLLHTRLSIIDLDHRADQPMRSDDCVLAYNGEIYNYRELRQELVAAGHSFRTQSDTEVIIKAYRQWGTDCFRRFEGMWALALFDQRTKQIILSRDRFGEKPLFWTHWDGALFFASEIKAIAALSGRKPRVNRQQVARYLVNGYKALNKRAENFFADVHEFPAGSHAVIERFDEPPRPRHFWTLEFSPREMSLSEALDGTRDRLLRAVELRLRADVPIAFCLSGGVDSTALAFLAAKRFGCDVTAFSVVDNDPRYDESDNLAISVARMGCRHHVTRVSPAGFFERIAALVAYHDAPVATISYYVHSFLSEAIHEGGFKVAVSGTGADELFTGYYDHYAMWLADRSGEPDFGRLVAEWRAGYGAMVRNPILKDPLAFAENPGERGHIYLDRETFNDLMMSPLDEDFEEAMYARDLLRNRMLNELAHESVPVMLKEDDANSMMFSVENRSPFLDSKLAEFAYTIPNRHMIKDGMAKWLVRNAALPEAPREIMFDRRKRGFNASIDSLIDRSDSATMDRLLAPGPIYDFVDRTRMEVFLKGPMTDNSRSKFLFSFISAKTFLESDLVAG